MHVLVFGFFLFFILATLLISSSETMIMSITLIFAVIALVVIAKRNFDIKKHNLNKYDENELIIQNVQKGGIIRLTNVDGQTGNLDLKVASRNIYIEGDYSWSELECINANGEKFWIDIDDDDELVVSIVINKPTLRELKFSSNLEDIEENESGSVTYIGNSYQYTDSGDAIFHKYGIEKRQERLYYYDFRNDNYIISVERWENGNGVNDVECFVSQILKPSTIIVYSTKGVNNTHE